MIERAICLEKHLHSKYPRAAKAFDKFLCYILSVRCKLGIGASKEGKYGSAHDNDSDLLDEKRPLLRI